MARISRKPGRTAVLSNGSAVTVYSTGVYARLSVEDNGREGSSIEDQISMLKLYVAQKPDLALYRVYFDNGATGTNFQRPGFMALMEDIRARHVNCVVVKDLSRFGRNLVETGSYLEEIFPYLNVRFISVNDDYDSAGTMDSNQHMTASIKNLVHQMYAKDISQKICTSLAVRKKSGEFFGRVAPFGYLKSGEDNHRLVIDRRTAPIVERVFQWRLEGLGVTAIARRLNDAGVPTPSNRDAHKGNSPRETREGARAVWRGSTVAYMLRNPAYAGCLCERKTEQAYYKGGIRRKIREGEWRLIEDTHEAIVDGETFEAIRRLTEKNRGGKAALPERKADGEQAVNTLKGLVICGVCKNKMVRSSGYRPRSGAAVSHYFNCARRYVQSGGCPARSIKEAGIKKAAFGTLQALIQLAGGAFAARWCDLEKGILQRQLAQARAAVREAENLKYGLYPALKAGTITRDTYEHLIGVYGQRIKSAERQFDGIVLRLTALEDAVAQEGGYVTAFSGDAGGEKRAGEMAAGLVEAVVVYGGNRVELHLKFRDVFCGTPPHQKIREEGGV